MKTAKVFPLECLQRVHWYYSPSSDAVLLKQFFHNLLCVKIRINLTTIKRLNVHIKDMSCDPYIPIHILYYFKMYDFTTLYKNQEYTNQR